MHAGEKCKLTAHPGGISPLLAFSPRVQSIVFRPLTLRGESAGSGAGRPGQFPDIGRDVTRGKHHVMKSSRPAWRAPIVSGEGGLESRLCEVAVLQVSPISRSIIGSQRRTPHRGIIRAR